MSLTFLRKNPLYILLLVLTIIVHITYIPNGFTWLDQRDIVEKRAVLPVSAFTKAFTNRYGDTGFYRPLVTLSLSTDAAIYRYFSPGYHLTNVIFFILIVALLPFFMQDFFSFTFRQGILAAAFFSVHPFGFLPVGAISYRPELLLTLFTLLSIYCFHKQKKIRDLRYTIGTIIFFICALLSKETALVLIPISIFLHEISSIILFNAKTKKMKQGVVSYSIPGKTLLTFFLVSICYLFLRFIAVPELWRVTVKFPDTAAAIFSRLHIIGKLLLLFFSPIIPTISDSTPIISIPDYLSFIGFSVISILLFAAIRIGLKQTLGKTLLMFILFLLPAANLIPVPRMSSPHYGFIALIPFSALVIFLSERIKRTQIAKAFPLLPFLAVIWFSISVVATFSSGIRFTNDETLFLPDVSRDKNFHEGAFYLGTYYLQNENFSQAEKFYLAALHDDPHVMAYGERFSVMTNLAAVYYKEKKYREADTYLLAAENIAPFNELNHIRYDRALIASENHDYISVITLLSKKEFSNNKYALLLLADALHNMHDDKRAISVLQQSLPYWSPEERLHVEQEISELAAKTN